MDHNLESKARHFQTLIEDLFLDEEGLIRGCLHAATRKLWEPTYFDPPRDVLRAPGLPAPEVWWAYEQTNMCHGFYLLSLVYQYRVTGDTHMLDLARRTFQSIWRDLHAWCGLARRALCWA